MSKIISSQDENDPFNRKLEYLLLCQKEAREEIMYRLKARDNYLKLHLFFQAATFCISEGILFAGIDTQGTQFPEALYLVAPAAFTAVLLTIHEDRLLDSLSLYVSRIARCFDSYNWCGSPEIRGYSEASLFYSFVARVIFLVLSQKLRMIHLSFYSSDVIY